MPEDYDFEAAIVPRNRVCEINLSYITRSQFQRLASAMQEQFPALMHLKLVCKVDYSLPAPARWAVSSLPDGFLSGSAPRLQSLQLSSTSFPALPKLLLSATDLVYLTLSDFPRSENFSPETFVTCLAVLVNLKSLFIEFKDQPAPSNWESRRPSLITRTVLPALTRFEFQGDSEYLEDVVARIDTPLLDSIWITFFQLFIFDFPQLAQFMRRTTRFQEFNEAHVDFNMLGVQVASLPPTRAFDENFGLRILDWRILSLIQTMTSFFPSIYTVEHLYIYRPECLIGDFEDGEWLEFIHPFTSVKNLYVVKEMSQSIAFALQELVGEDVLPALESLFLEDFGPPVQEAIGPFIAARQLSGHPVAVSHWPLDYVRICLFTPL